MVIEPLRNANAAAKCLLKNPQRVKKSTEKVGPFEALVNLRLRRWDTSSGASVLLRYEYDIYIRVASLTPNFTNMAQTTYLHVLIDIFMSAELKKCNETPKKFARTLNFAH